MYSVTERTIDIRGLQNIEPEVTNIIKAEPYCELSSVKYDNGKLTLIFEENKQGRKVSSYVKQVSKKKYRGLDSYFLKVHKQGGYLLTVIDLPKVWLCFYNKTR